MDKTTFTQHLSDAYAHLYDMVHLRTHPLTPLLAADSGLSRKEKAWKTHHILLDVIGELKPESQNDAFARQNRRHQLMIFRYVKGLEPQAVADQLTISRRHFYREHSAAIEAIADILWHRVTTEPTDSEPVIAPIAQEQPADSMELLRMEAARLAQAGRYAYISDVIEDVHSLLEGIFRQRNLELEPALPETLPRVDVGRDLLKQMLLGILGYLIEYAEWAKIQLLAQVEEAQIHLLARIEPTTAILPAAQTEMRERLSMFDEMATLSGAVIQPVHSGETVTGFKMSLPVARQIVLVVDDNQDILDLFRRYLSANLYHVVTTQSAEESLNLARRLQPHAITLDLMMPGQDGWSLLQALRNQPETQNIPIIVCSVLKLKELALSLGATAFLKKPVKEQALLSVLKALEKA